MSLKVLPEALLPQSQTHKLKALEGVKAQGGRVQTRFVWLEVGPDGLFGPTGLFKTVFLRVVFR